jgi:hypothetical protein
MANKLTGQRGHLDRGQGHAWASSRRSCSGNKNKKGWAGLEAEEERGSPRKSHMAAHRDYSEGSLKDTRLQRGPFQYKSDQPHHFPCVTWAVSHSRSATPHLWPVSSPLPHNALATVACCCPSNMWSSFILSGPLCFLISLLGPSPRDPNPSP